MGVRILCDGENGDSCFYCSTTMWAFGPVMRDYETAEGFCEWLNQDARKYKDTELETKYYEYLDLLDKGGE